MPVKIWVGRFAIVEGQPQEESALLRSFPRQRPEEDEDELFVLAQPATPQSKELDAIDKELDANRAKMKTLTPSSDEYDKLRDRNLDLDTQRTNIMQAAARGERTSGG